MTNQNSPQIKIAYLILCHENIYLIRKLIDHILSEDSSGEVFVHFDGKSSYTSFLHLKLFFLSHTRCHFIEERKKCGWGEFSLVAATMELLLLSYQYDCSYYYLLSENCFPMQPLNSLKSFLSKHIGSTFIECQSSTWIQAGMKEDRYYYYHFLNYRKNPKFFKFFYRIQKYIKLKKKLPFDIEEIRFGSQWWCLYKTDIENIISFLNKRNDIVTFFKYAWIPDECFFQTILWHLNKDNIIQNTLTYYRFDEQGKPVIFQTNKNFDSISLSQKFFYRKVTS